MAFPELLRANRLGMSDPLDRALSLAEHRTLTGGSRGMRPMQRQQQGGVPDWIRQEQINRRGLPPGVENVVYDQGPEEFAKKHKLAMRESETRSKQQESYNNRIIANMENQERRLEETSRANMAREKHNQSMEEGRNKRADAQYDAAQKRVETQQAGATGRTGLSVAGADLRSQRNAELRRDLQAAGSQAEMDQIMQRYQNEYALKDTFKPRVSLNERVQEMMGKALSENPDYWKVIEQDERGNYRIIPPAAGTSGLSGGADPVDTLRKQLTRKIYGPQEVPLNQGANREMVDPRQPVAPGGQTGYGPQPQRRQPTNQADLARLSAGIKQDFQTKKGRPPSEQELEAIMAHYLGGQ